MPTGLAAVCSVATSHSTQRRSALPVLEWAAERRVCSGPPFKRAVRSPRRRHVPPIAHGNRPQRAQAQQRSWRAPARAPRPRPAGSLQPRPLVSSHHEIEKKLSSRPDRIRRTARSRPPPYGPVRGPKGIAWPAGRWPLVGRLAADLDMHGPSCTVSCAATRSPCVGRIWFDFGSISGPAGPKCRIRQN